MSKVCASNSETNYDYFGSTTVVRGGFPRDRMIFNGSEFIILCGTSLAILEH